jgi:ABC-2 type transport system permease protein
MTIVLSDLRMRRSSLIWWSLAVLATVAMVDAFYPSVAQAPAMDQMYAELPESLRDLLGPTDITSPVGYLSSQLYLFFLPVVLMVFAIGRAVGSLAGEEEDHTLDLLLAQPISRNSLYLFKVATICISVFILGVISLIPNLALAGPLDFDISTLNFVAVTVQMCLVVLVFASVALAVSAATGRKVLGIAAAAGYGFAGYLIDGLGQSVDWLEPLRPLTPWYWFGANDALTSGFSWSGVLVLVGAAVGTALIGMVLFNRRNLRS